MSKPAPHRQLVGFDGADAFPAPQSPTFALGAALCFYRSSEQRSPQDATYSLAMLHRADRTGLLGPGQPVDPVEFARTLYRLKQGELVEKLVLTEEHVLAENRDAVLWWRPAAVAPMWFKTATPAPALTALNGVPLPHPPLVFKASKRRKELSVWALLGNVRPTAHTALYHAPYMNGYQQSGDGAICLGSGQLDPAHTTPAQWEKFFFDSNFSHTPPRLNHGKDKNPDPLQAYAAFLEKLRRAHQANPLTPQFEFHTKLLPAGRKLSRLLGQ